MSIILLAGLHNAGKSTVGLTMRYEVPRVSFMDLDNIHWFLPAEIPLEEAMTIIVDNATMLAADYIGRGYRIVMTYFFTKDMATALTERLAPLQVPVTTIILKPRFELLVTNRGTRELGPWEIDAIHERQAAGWYAEEFAPVIDNSEQTPQETVAQVMALANWTQN